MLLGIGWNFLFVGGSLLLASVHTEAGRGKVQGINDLVIFTLLAVASLHITGSLLHHLGWATLNLSMLAPVALVVMPITWPRIRTQGVPVSGG